MRSEAKEITPKHKVMGMGLFDKYMYFYSVNYHEDYPKGFVKGIFKSNLGVNKFPEDGFNLSSFRERSKKL